MTLPNRLKTVIELNKVYFMTQNQCITIKIGIKAAPAGANIVGQMLAPTGA